MALVRIVTKIIFLFLPVSVSAQPGFNQIKDFAEVGCGLINGSIRNDTIFLIGGIRNTGTNWGVALIKADTNGNILGIHPYFDPDGKTIGFGVNYDMKLLPDGSVVFLGGYFSETSHFLIKYNATGEVTHFKKIHYDDAYSIVTYDFEPYKDGYMIGGTVVDLVQNKFQPFLTRTDAEGDVLWTKRYPETGKDQNSRCMKVLDENTIVFGSVLGVFNNPYWLKSRIFALDSLGNPKWEWRTPDSNEGLVSDIIKMDNGDWLYLNKKFEVYSQDSVLSWSQLVRRDSNFNLIFATRLSPTKWAWNQTNDLVPSADGHWIVSETTALVGPDFSWLGSSGWAGCLTKITSEGEILWQTCDTIHWNIPGVLSEETASGHVVLPSGSSILIGVSNRWKPTPARSFGWMFKVDANGCMMEPCVSDTETAPDPLEEDWRLYPNPARQTLHVQGPKSQEDINLCIYNSIGQFVAKYQIESWEEGKTLDISTFNSGVYIIHVTNAQGILFAEKFVVQH